MSFGFPHMTSSRRDSNRGHRSKGDSVFKIFAIMRKSKTPHFGDGSGPYNNAFSNFIKTNTEFLES